MLTSSTRLALTFWASPPGIDEKYFSIMCELSDRLGRLAENSTLCDEALWKILQKPENESLVKMIETEFPESPETLRAMRTLVTFWLFC